VERQSQNPVPREQVGTCAAASLTLVYSAPTPGQGSRYVDGPVAHEVRVLWALPARDALVEADRAGIGETVLEAALACNALTGAADPRAVAYLAPLARAALLGRGSGTVLAGLGHDEIQPFVRALEVADPADPLSGTLRMALGAGRGATLRDAMRFAAARDALAREYARNFEVTRELARPALLSALSRADSARGALVQTYLEVLSEVPDTAVAGRAGKRDAEDVSRMARGVLKAGGVHSRRGLEGIANLDGILRADPRLAPSATEPPVVAAAFLVALEYGADVLSFRLRPANPHHKGR
jgi:triphosphoribosyl-dephospho-CoA synthase